MRKKVKTTIALVTAMLTIAAMVGCAKSNTGGTTGESSSASASDPAKKEYTFVYIPQGAIPFYQSVNTGIEAAAKTFGNIKLKYDAPATMTDNAVQLTMFKNAVTAHVDGIILSPQNPEAFVKPIEEAIKQGIPVITVDTGVQPNVANSYIATSNIDAAKKVAQYMAEKVQSKGTHVVLNFNHSSSTAIARQDGWEQAMKDIPTIKSLGSQLTNNDPGIAQSAAATFYQRDNSLNLIFATNYLNAAAVAKFIKTSNLKDKVFLAGFDVDDGVLDYVKQGYISATVIQYPYDMGYKALEHMMDIKAGKSVPKEIQTDTFILTPENVNTPEAIKAIGQYIAGYTGK